MPTIHCESTSARREKTTKYIELAALLQATNFATKNGGPFWDPPFLIEEQARMPVSRLAEHFEFLDAEDGVIT